MKPTSIHTALQAVIAHAQLENHVSKHLIMRYINLAPICQLWHINCALQAKQIDSLGLLDIKFHCA